MVSPGSRPSATTRATSVFRVTTPTSSPSVADDVHGAYLRGRQHLAGLARGRRDRERPRLGDHRVADAGRLLAAHPLRGRARAPRGRRRRRGSRRRAPPSASRSSRSLETSQTRSNASLSFSASFARISSRPQKSRPRSCTHSKYETVTPPAFVRMSGRTEDPALPQDRVRLERGRAVGALGDHPAAEARRVVGVELVLAGSEDEDVALQLEQLLVRDPPAGLPALERPVLQGVRAHRRDVEPGRVVDAARDVRDGDDGRAAVDELLGGDPADVAESLHDAALLGQFPAEALAGARDDHHDPRPRRLVPEDGAADRDRLARHDLRDRVAALHRVGVHHPGHRLLVRRHVRRRDVLLRADEREQLRGEAAREALELRPAERARVAADAALRATVGQPQERALPRHPDGERRALAERDLGVVPDAALRRAEHARVLHAVAGEDDAGPSSSRIGQETMIDRSGCRSRSATPGSTSAYGTAWSNWATAVR